MYAIFEDGSRQYKVAEGDQIDVDYRDISVGERLEFDRVLLLSANDKVHVGTPTVEDAKIITEVLDHVRDEKIVVQRFKRRKKFRRRSGHRQKLTRVRVRQILPTGLPATK